jgi:hypothetical protein
VGTRAPRQRPLALALRPGELSWVCPCDSCVDLVAAQLCELTEDTVPPTPTSASEDDVPPSFAAI